MAVFRNQWAFWYSAFSAVIWLVTAFPNTPCHSLNRCHQLFLHTVTGFQAVFPDIIPFFLAAAPFAAVIPRLHLPIFPIYRGNHSEDREGICSAFWNKNIFLVAIFGVICNWPCLLRAPQLVSDSPGWLTLQRRPSSSLGG